MMDHTKKAVKHHLTLWRIVGWLALLGLAFCVDVVRDDNGEIAVEWRDLP